MIIFNFPNDDIIQKKLFFENPVEAKKLSNPLPLFLLSTKIEHFELL